MRRRGGGRLGARSHGGAARAGGAGGSAGPPGAGAGAGGRRRRAPRPPLGPGRTSRGTSWRRWRGRCPRRTVYGSVWSAGAGRRPGRRSRRGRSTSRREGDADARGGRGGERGARQIGAWRPRWISAGEVQRTSVRFFCRRRAPRGPPVGAAKGYPWDEYTCAMAVRNGHIKVLQSEAGPWVPLGHFYVHGGCL